jgi:hypothetical protein
MDYFSGFVLFGDPNSLQGIDPQPVPSLRYAWTGGMESKGEIIDNPVLPGTVRSIVIRNHEDKLSSWFTESRNLLDDFMAAFGREPAEPQQGLNLLTDNDQTKVLTPSLGQNAGF